MLIKKHTYTTFTGKEVTKNFCFNLTEAEVLRMEATTEGGLTNRLQRMIDAKSPKEIFENFERIFDSAYGIPSEDGEDFMKSPEILAKFKASQAYSDLYVLYATNDEEAAHFINSVMPPKFVKAAAEAKQAELAGKTEP